MTRSQFSAPTKPSRWAGLGQLTLVEHALCPLDPKASLVENLVFDAAYYFSDRNRNWQRAKARISCPLGISANDEFYLWGLLALAFAQPDPDMEFHATPHYCLRQLGLIDQHARRGGQQYRQFAEAMERLSLVRYRNDQFYDPIRTEHRKVSFGFFSYSLPPDLESSRAWRIAWDPIFFEVARATSGHFHFDLEVYRRLDPASRRLFMLLCKVFHRRATSPRFDLQLLAVNVLGFAPTVTSRDLKIKVRRCIDRLAELKVVAVQAPEAIFQTRKLGEYSLILSRGDYFQEQEGTRLPFFDSPLVEPLHELGFTDSSIRHLLKTYSAPLLQVWIDITLAAKERHGQAFFKKSPQAYLVDNLKQAFQGHRTPPDWWLDLRKKETRMRIMNFRKARSSSRENNPPEKADGVVSRIVEEMLGQLNSAGQPPGLARHKAYKFAQEFLRKSPAVPRGKA